ncbi:F-box/FBD/LRR-repeat protein At1g13570-like [Bidens hawaiensis]|uniref:F-box/FBD/LRR-repeat protein At1g13570-like n=1 Tax=Bidens hawaiensis TaxID=980011 RepID=UPI00404919EC
MDIISKLPLGIIENILCCLPIQEAGRTSILSREWRYRWNKIPKLVFIENTFQESTNGAKLSTLGQAIDTSGEKKKIAKRCKLFNAIYEVLLVHEGPIHEFTLHMEIEGSCVENDRILLHLSKKKTVKRLKLDLYTSGVEGYTLPISIFSLHHLTDMYLSDCALYHERTFNEFGRLTTLYLDGLWTYATTLLRLLSSCPLLKKLTLVSSYYNRMSILMAFHNLAENCKILQHSFGATIIDGGDSTIVDLFKCLPMIEYLSVLFFIVKCFVPERLPKELPLPLIHLKYLCMEELCFTHKYGLPFLVLLIRSSLNLEKLKQAMYPAYWLDKDEKGSFTLEDYSDIMLEHLNELKILNFSDAENELDFVKLVYAKSPVLKQVRIFLCDEFDEDEELEISKLLLNIPCASPAVEKLIYAG